MWHAKIAVQKTFLWFFYFMIWIQFLEFFVNVADVIQKKSFSFFFLSYCHYIKLIKHLSWYYSWNWIIHIKCSHQFNCLFRQGIGTKVVLGVAPTSMPLFQSDCQSVLLSVAEHISGIVDHGTWFLVHLCTILIFWVGK